MKPQAPTKFDIFDDPLADAEGLEEMSEDDLWFLPGQMEVEPDYLPPGPRAELRETAVLDDWRKAEASNAAHLARVAGRIGALDDRMHRGPEGWRHRLALMQAADLSWFVGDRIGADRLALWISMRLSGVQDDTAALARVGWAVRRLTGGPGPEVDLSAFLDRRDPENIADEAETFADRAGGWLDLMAQTADLHPITHAPAWGFTSGALRASGNRTTGWKRRLPPHALRPARAKGPSLRLWLYAGQGACAPVVHQLSACARWLEGMETACLTAMRHLDDIEAWSAAGANHDGPALWQDTTSIARCAD